jgi:hypothetical protein
MFRAMACPGAVISAAAKHMKVTTPVKTNPLFMV